MRFLKHRRLYRRCFGAMGETAGIALTPPGQMQY
jgi:hypothetical protein